VSNVTVNIINGFVEDSGEGGNPAGVVLNAELSRAAKQRIAFRVGVSETAFVSSSDVADYKLEFFTPTRQIAHCGHATIATFSYLAQQGKLSSERSSKETIDGIRDIRLSRGLAFMEQSAPAYARVPDADGLTTQSVMASLNSSEERLLPGLEPVVVNTGNSFLVVPLRSGKAVEDLKPDWNAISTISEQLDLIGYYVFSNSAQQYGRSASARMFAPRYGIEEEAATGMAAGPLACYLHDFMKIPGSTFEIEQGYLMPTPSPSKITVHLGTDNHRITGLMAGGRGRVVTSIEVAAD